MIKSLFKKKSRKNLPSIMIIGAQKAATSSLHNYLIQHPDIQEGNEKEVHFFDYNFNYNKGINWYQDQFPENGRLFLDSTPRYLYEKDVPRRIKQHIENDIKFIVVLREPLSRAYSAWNMYLQFKDNADIKSSLMELDQSDDRYNFSSYYTSVEFPSFEEAIESELKLIENGSSVIEPSILRRGFYIEQIENWLEYYPREHFLFLQDGDLEANNAIETLNIISEFIGMNSNFDWSQIDLRKQNKRTYNSSMIGDDLKFKVNTLFKEKNKSICELTGLSLDWKCLK
jgi:Sulfotransferase domain